MRVHVVKLGVLSALVAAVVAQTASTRALTTAVPASDRVLLQGATHPAGASSDTTRPGPDEASGHVTTSVDVPAAWSFDDAHGAADVAAGVLAPTSAAPRPRPAPRKPPRPPSTARTGAMPAAGTPQAVLAAAYVEAASRAPRGCHLLPAHLAAIGQVESGSVGGRRIGSDHRVSPAIYGPLLDGGPFAVVHDSDGGAYDGASDYDRAVGPLQFLPGTWRWAGRDGDGDGRRDPQNVFDASLATADYLCRDGRDLSRAGDLRAAVLTYNWSGEYVAAVTQWVSFFSHHGLAAMDDVAFRVGSGGRASDLAVAKPAKDAKDAKGATKAPQGPGATPSPAPATPTATTTQPPTGTTTTTPGPSPTTTTPDPTSTTPAPDPTTPTTSTTPTPTAPEPAPTTSSTAPALPTPTLATPSGQPSSSAVSSASSFPWTAPSSRASTASAR